MLQYEEAIKAGFELTGRSGNEFTAWCPWHEDSHGGRSNLYINGKTGFYFCHVCHAKGKLEVHKPSPESLLGRVQDMKQNGIGSKKVMREPETLPEAFLEQFRYVNPYWETRGLTEATVDEWDLGFDVIQNHATIPFRDHNGNLKGVIRRTLNDDEVWRYKNPSAVLSNHYLFGSHMLEGRRKVALVEGPADALACWNARVPAVAVFGSYVSDHQIKLMRRLGIYHAVLMFDDDKAGRKANKETWHRLHHFTVSKGTYRNYWGAKDPGALKPAQIRKLFHSAKMITDSEEL